MRHDAAMQMVLDWWVDFDVDTDVDIDIDAEETLKEKFEGDDTDKTETAAQEETLGWFCDSDDEESNLAMYEDQLKENFEGDDKDTFAKLVQEAWYYTKLDMFNDKWTRRWLLAN